MIIEVGNTTEQLLSLEDNVSAFGVLIAHRFAEWPITCTSYGHAVLFFLSFLSFLPPPLQFLILNSCVWNVFMTWLKFPMHKWNAVSTSKEKHLLLQKRRQRATWQRKMSFRVRIIMQQRLPCRLHLGEIGTFFSLQTDNLNSFSDGYY